MTFALQADQVQSTIVRRVIENLRIDCSSNTQLIIRQDSITGSDDGAVIMQAVADITVDIAVSGVNGLDTGVESLNTWYYIYMIWNPSSGLVRGLLSASPTVPVLPSGYTKKRLIGVVRNDGSSNFNWFIQNGNEVNYMDLNDNYILIGGTATTFTGIDPSSAVPYPLSRVIHLQWSITPSSPPGGNSYLSISTNSSTQVVGAGGTEAVGLKTAGTFYGLIIGGTFYYKVDAGNSTVIAIYGFTLSL